MRSYLYKTTFLTVSSLERYAVLVRTAPFLGVTGKLEARDNVVHLIADELWTPRLNVQPQHGRSRDFH